MGKKGFTLIELLVTITILAIISTFGYISYSQAQSSARDAKRKQDLKAVQTALLLYYQKNKSYPQANNWVTSSNQFAWSGLLGSSYIDKMPLDPLANNSNPWVDDSYGYAYLSDDASLSGCTLGTGKWYALVAQLENDYDPEGDGAKLYNWCPNPNPSRVSFPGGVAPALGNYIITVP